MTTTRALASRKTSTINIRTTENQKKQIEAKAKSRGMTITKYLEMVIAGDTTSEVSILRESALERLMSAPEGCLMEARRLLDKAVDKVEGEVEKDLEWVMRTTMLAEALAELDPNGQMWYPYHYPDSDEEDDTKHWSTLPVVQTKFPTKRNVVNFLQDAINPEDISYGETIAKPKEPQVVIPPERPQQPQSVKPQPSKWVTSSVLVPTPL